jgi:hypothetical protein
LWEVLARKGDWNPAVQKAVIRIDEALPVIELEMKVFVAILWPVCLV